jgi:hypothetical protein
MKNRRGLLIIFFILTLFISNIVKASEGISPGQARQPSFSSTGGASETSPQTVQQALETQTQKPAGTTVPKKEKSWVQKLEESSNRSVKDGAPRTPLTLAISYLIKFLTIIFTTILLISFVRIFLHLKKQRAVEVQEEESAEKQETSDHKENEISNISDAVASFVKHRLKK